MSAQQIFRMRNPALLMALAAVFPVISYAASAANVDFSVGSVTAVNAVGVQRPLSRGAEIGNGDTIRTGDGGRAQVRFSDGAMVSLQPQTEFRIDNYQYSGKDDGQEKGFFSLLKGGLRTITGLIGRSSRDNYRVSTSVATIGIRGTEYSAGMNGEDLDVATGEGAIIVCNDQGCVELTSGEAGSVHGHDKPHRRHTRPRLRPAQILEDVRPVFSSGDLGIGQQSSLPPLTGTQTYATVYAHVETICCGPGSFSGKGVGPGTIDPNGTLSSFTSAEGVLGANVAGGNTIPVGDGFQGNDGIVAWGRWINSGAGFTGPSMGGGEGVMHYVTGLPTAYGDLAALSGTSASYSLIGGGVTGSSAGPGTINSASMTVNFTLATVDALHIGMTLSSGVYNINSVSPIGIGSLAGAAVFSDILVPVIGSGCASGCSGATVNGAFFGAGAARAGVSFGFSDGTQQIGGAAALKKGP
jgi:hypothetical protein